MQVLEIQQAVMWATFCALEGASQWLHLLGQKS